jgi:hypothetical protein
VTRPARLLAGLVVIALLGVGALSYLARQYEKRARLVPSGAADEGSSRAVRLVAGFLAAGATETPSEEALAGAGISREEYDAVRRAALEWRDARPVPDTDLAAALEARAGEVRALLAR